MTTLTQLTKDLGIGKGTLYKTLSDLGITPHQQGRKRVLDDDQVQKIQSAIVSASDSRPSETVNRQTRDARTDDSNVINVLQKQIEHLKILLDSEKSEKSQLLDQMNQSQQLMLAMQTETMRLRSENQKLLLGHTTTAEAKGSSRDIDGLIEVSALNTATSSRSNWAWSGLMLAAMGALGWVLYQLPSLEALQFAGW